MASRSMVPVEEYLRMKFDRPDPEYLDGELVERHLGNDSHSAAQVELIAALHPLHHQGRVALRSELHLRISPSRYRIADLAIFLERPVEPIPSSPPLVTIEIVSPDDSLREIREKSEEYRAWGVRHIWLVDPSSHTFSVYDENGMRDVAKLELPELSFELTPEQVFG
jgi:Uma2 family endonuclease